MFKWRNVFQWLSVTFIALALSGCGYNTLQTTDEDIKATWAEVLNQYQRRADLVPNLVNVVKGYAAHEKDVFISVTEARARVGAIQATPELINVTVRSFPSNLTAMLFGYKTKPTFTVENEKAIAQPPKVDFGTPAAPRPAPAPAGGRDASGNLSSGY